MFRNREAVIDGLSTIPGLQGWPRQELGLLARVTSQVEVDAGRVLCREGAPAFEAFLVADGEADVLVGGGCVARVGPGAFVGEMALLDKLARSATVVAVTPMTLLVMTPAEFATLLADAPRLTRRMMADLSRRLRGADRRLPARSA